MTRLPVKESRLWKYLREGMSRVWMANRVESSTTAGIPDVEFALFGTSGWIELKALDEFPKRAHTRVRIPHLTAEQRLWFNTRLKYKKDCWLLVRVAEEHFLFTGEQVPMIGEMTAADWRMRAAWHWQGRINFTMLAQLLTEGYE